MINWAFGFVTGILVAIIFVGRSMEKFISIVLPILVSLGQRPVSGNEDDGEGETEGEGGDEEDATMPEPVPAVETNGKQRARQFHNSL